MYAARAVRLPRAGAAACDHDAAHPGGSRGDAKESRNAGFLRMETTCRKCLGGGTIIASPCSACHGRGVTRARRTVTVNVPPGVDDNIEIRVASRPADAEPGEQSQYIYVRLHVTPSPVFRREGNHVHVAVPISMSQATLGGTVRVPGLHGDLDVTVRIQLDDAGAPLGGMRARCACRVVLGGNDVGRRSAQIPPGTQPEDKLRLRGQGIPSMNGSSRGDQYVQFRVQIPKCALATAVACGVGGRAAHRLTPRCADRRLTERQRELMEAFATLEHDRTGTVQDDRAARAGTASATTADERASDDEASHGGLFGRIYNKFVGNKEAAGEARDGGEQTQHKASGTNP